MAIFNSKFPSNPPKSSQLEVLEADAFVTLISEKLFALATLLQQGEKKMQKRWAGKGGTSGKMLI
jgi:hypothetical protein